MEFNTGFFEGTQAVALLGLSTAEAAVDYFCELDNSSDFTLGFAEAVSTERLNRMG